MFIFNFRASVKIHTYKVDYTEQIAARPQILHAVSFTLTLTLCYSPVCFAAVSTGSGNPAPAPVPAQAPHVVHEKKNIADMSPTVKCLYACGSLAATKEETP